MVKRVDEKYEKMKMEAQVKKKKKIPKSEGGIGGLEREYWFM